jgi:hypothetical protein
VGGLGVQEQGQRVVWGWRKVTRQKDESLVSAPQNPTITGKGVGGLRPHWMLWTYGGIGSRGTPGQASGLCLLQEVQ